MSSFFTLPASQTKRKRSGGNTKESATKRRRPHDDDSISGSEDSGEDAANANISSDDDEEEEFGDEDPAAKRVRLAEQYLANTQREVLEDGGFDAAEIDRENLQARMGERLKQDTAESKGKLYRWLAADLDWQNARVRRLKHRHVHKCYTSVAIQGSQVFAVSKDLHLVKWELSSAALTEQNASRARSKPKVVASSRGHKSNPRAQHHNAAILCIAVSQDGRFVATGGVDKKLIVWDANDLRPLKVFMHHRDAVTALAFRRGTHQLFSASRDRTVKIWSLDELAYVETLFGHQDQVIDVDALAQEQCVTVGARDRTARLWKVVEESQLVFRGGGAPPKSKAMRDLKAAYGDDAPDHEEEQSYYEGSIDCIAVIDDDTFVTGSDNGSISLWDIRKKKPVYTLPLAHGVDPALSPNMASAEVEPDYSQDERTRGGKHPRWITALAAIPFSDTILSGSWDGHIRVWKLSRDKRKIESLGAIVPHKEQPIALSDGVEPRKFSGVVNRIAIIDHGDRGKKGILVAAAIGNEHRLGRWRDVQKGEQSNELVLLEITRKPQQNGVNVSGVAEHAIADTAEQNGMDVS